MDVQELQNHEKVSAIWVKNLNKIVNKMNNTVLSMIGMKPKGVIKLDTVLTKLHYLKMDCIDNFINLVNNMETRKDGQQTLYGVKMHTK